MRVNVQEKGGLFVATTAIGFQPGEVVELSLPEPDEEEGDE